MHYKSLFLLTTSTLITLIPWCDAANRKKINSQAVKASTSYITVARNGSIMIDHAAWNKSSLLLWIISQNA